MQFNYIKVLLKVFTPKEGSKEQNMIVSEYRKGAQQAHTFTREF